MMNIFITIQFGLISLINIYLLANPIIKEIIKFFVVLVTLVVLRAVTTIDVYEEDKKIIYEEDKKIINYFIEEDDKPSFRNKFNIMLFNDFFASVEVFLFVKTIVLYSFLFEEDKKIINELKEDDKPLAILRYVFFLASVAVFLFAKTIVLYSFLLVFVAVDLCVYFYKVLCRKKPVNCDTNKENDDSLTEKDNPNGCEQLKEEPKQNTFGFDATSISLMHAFLWYIDSNSVDSNERDINPNSVDSNENFLNFNQWEEEKKKNSNIDYTSIPDVANKKLKKFFTFQELDILFGRLFPDTNIEKTDYAGSIPVLMRSQALYQGRNQSHEVFELTSSNKCLLIPAFVASVILINNNLVASLKHEIMDHHNKYKIKCSRAGLETNTAAFYIYNLAQPLFYYKLDCARKKFFAKAPKYESRYIIYTEQTKNTMVLKNIPKTNLGLMFKDFNCFNASMLLFSYFFKLYIFFVIAPFLMYSFYLYWLSQNSITGCKILYFFIRRLINFEFITKVCLAFFSILSLSITNSFDNVILEKFSFLNSKLTVLGKKEENHRLILKQNIIENIHNGALPSLKLKIFIDEKKYKNSFFALWQKLFKTNLLSITNWFQSLAQTSLHIRMSRSMNSNLWFSLSFFFSSVLNIIKKVILFYFMEELIPIINKHKHNEIILKMAKMKKNKQFIRYKLYLCFHKAAYYFIFEKIIKSLDKS